MAGAANIVMKSIESSGNAIDLILEGKDYNSYYDYYTLTQLLKQESFATESFAIGVNTDTTSIISNSMIGKPISAQTTTTLSASLTM